MCFIVLSFRVTRVALSDWVGGSAQNNLPDVAQTSRLSMLAFRQRRFSRDNERVRLIDVKAPNCHVKFARLMKHIQKYRPANNRWYFWGSVRPGEFNGGNEKA